MRIGALRNRYGKMAFEMQLLMEIEQTVSDLLFYLKVHDPSIYSQLIILPHQKRVENDLFDIIYRINLTDENIVSRYFYNIFDLKVKEEYSEELQHVNAEFTEKLERAYLIAIQHKDKLNISRGFGWVQVKPPHVLSIRRRMYLNCVPEHIDVVVNKLINLMLYAFKGGLLPQIAFKFPYFSGFDHRQLVKADKIIVYYGNDPTTHEILRKWARSMSRFFHSDAPRFTKQEIDGVGFAYEPLPEHYQYLREHPDDIFSFSSFMASVIAKYLYKWCLEHQKIPVAGKFEEFEEIAKGIRDELNHKYKFPFF